MILSIDIETAPTDDRRVDALLYKKLKPPKNYKDPDKVEEYLIAKLKDEVLKTALNPLFGRIISVAATYDGKTAHARTIDEVENEFELVSKFLEFISAWRERALSKHKTNGVIVGHNIFEFDLPFLYRRAVVLNIDINKYNPIPIPPPSEKPWRVNYVYDTMLAWGRPFPRLKELAMMFGLLTGDEDEMDGGDALQAFLSGDMKAVKTHNANDVIIGYKVAERMMKAGM